MDEALYYRQLLPALALLVLLVVNLVLKRSLFCPSSLALLYTFLSFAGAVVMVGMPRTGEPYVNSEAVRFLTLCYSVFCLPILFYKDGRLADGTVALAEPHRFRWLAFALIALTVPAALYALSRSLSSFGAFLHGGVSREQFRMAVNISKTATPVGTVMNTAAAFSQCATVAAICGLAFGSIGRWCVSLLFFGGMAFAIGTLENVARSGIFEYAMMVFVVFLLVWPRMRDEMRRRARRIVAVAAALLLIPFFALTVARFSSDDGGEGVGYSLFSYFATGPYSFSADYAARMEYGLPPTKGVLTNPYGLAMMDKVNGTSDYVEAEAELADRQLYNAPEYLAVCDGYACEFKTIVGSFLIDFSPPTVFWIMLGICAVFTALFQRSRGRPSDFVFAAVYFFMVFMGPIGYAYATRYRTTMMLLLVLFAFLMGRGEEGAPAVNAEGVGSRA